MRKFFSVSFFAFVIFLFLISTGNAILLTSNLLNDPTVIDFNQFANNQQGPFDGPVQVGADVTLEGKPYDGYDGAYLRNAVWGLEGNGSWNEGRHGFAAYGWGRPPGTLLFSFIDSPVSAVGAFINDAPEFNDFFISAYDAEMKLLESYDIWDLAPIRTPDGVNDGAFRGIALEASLISHFGVTGFVPVVDDLAFTSTPVPEPATMLLLGTGLLGLVGIGRKKIFKR